MSFPNFSKKPRLMFFHRFQRVLAFPASMPWQPGFQLFVQIFLFFTKFTAKQPSILIPMTPKTSLVKLKKFSLPILDRNWLKRGESKSKNTPGKKWLKRLWRSTNQHNNKEIGLLR